jgi:hypothetical protein
MPTSPSRNHGKPATVLTAPTCDLCQLLSRHKAIYSLQNRSNRLEFVRGTFAPIRCECCGKWFLVEESEGPLS